MNAYNDLITQLQKAIEFDGAAIRAHFWNTPGLLLGSEAWCFENGAEYRDKQLRPVLEALVKVVEVVDAKLGKWPREHSLLSNADRSMIEARAALTEAIGEMKCNQK